MLDAVALDPAASDSWDPYGGEELEDQWRTEAVESVFGAYLELILPTASRVCERSCWGTGSREIRFALAKPLRDPNAR